MSEQTWICIYDFQGEDCPYDEKCMKGEECEFKKVKDGETKQTSHHI